VNIITLEHLPIASESARVAVNVADALPDPGFLAVAIGGAGLILFVLFVLPVWLLLHYRSRSIKLAPPPAPQARTVSADDLAELVRLAERIEHRLDAVETLMDAERPRWRN
jgi:phage shock protein B